MVTGTRIAETRPSSVPTRSGGGGRGSRLPDATVVEGTQSLITLARCRVIRIVSAMAGAVGWPEKLVGRPNWRRLRLKNPVSPGGERAADFRLSPPAHHYPSHVLAMGY